MTAQSEVFERSRYRVVRGSCLDCAGDVAGTLRRLPHVERVQILPAAGVVVIEHTGELALAEVNVAAARIGLELEPAGIRVGDRTEKVWWRQPKSLGLAVAIDRGDLVPASAHHGDLGCVEHHDSLRASMPPNRDIDRRRAARANSVNGVATRPDEPRIPMSEHLRQIPEEGPARALLGRPGATSQLTESDRRALGSVKADRSAQQTPI